MSKTKITVTNLYKSFADKKVLDNINLQVNAGESHVIIGGSGTGKSVLIKNIALILTPDQGEILIDGKNILKASNREKKQFVNKIGYLFQGGALFDSLTIWENIAFKLLQSKISRIAAKNKALDALKDVGLESNIADNYPSELSGGMQKRVSLARTVITKPEIIFFDEPTTGLDPVMAEAIDNLILRYTEQLGSTAITITHDIASVKKISDNISMLHEGKIIWEGNLKALNNTDNKLVKNFIEGRFV